jgi:hypothetical protein
MTNPQSTLEAVVWVAIDVAKDRHEALIEAPGWKNRKKFRVQNTAQEFRAFADFLHSLGSSTRIGFEPTGNYHRALTYFLHSEGFQLELISSLAVARTREAMHNSWDKNDPKDAQVILHLLKSRLTQHYHDPTVHDLNDLQELSKTHHHVSLEKTRTQHRLLTHYLPLSASRSLAPAPSFVSRDLASGCRTLFSAVIRLNRDLCFFAGLGVLFPFAIFTSNCRNNPRSALTCVSSSACPALL